MVSRSCRVSPSLVARARPSRRALRYAGMAALGHKRPLVRQTDRNALAEGRRCCLRPKRQTCERALALSL
jgi:hypothetical protein